MVPRGFRPSLRARVLALAGSTALFGCNLGEGYADFGEDLGNPQEVVIDGPGTKIADVRLSGMLVDPWGDDGAVVVGFRSEDDGPHLYLQPFDGGEGCDAGPARRCIVFARLEGQPQLIAVLSNVNDSSRGTLNFVNHQCEIVYGGIEDAELPSRLFDFPPGFVVRAGERLLDIDPYAQSTRVMAEDLSFWSGPGDAGQVFPHYFVAGGQLVVFDDERAELGRFGEAVTEVVFASSDWSQGLFLVDDGNLVRYVATDEQSIQDVTPENVAEDVCAVSLGADTVRYFSPCAERTLVVRNLDDGSSETIDSGVAGIVADALREREDGSGTDAVVAYTKANAEDANFEDLWLKLAGQEPALWQSRLGRLLSVAVGESPTLTAIVESDGTVGRFIRVDSDGETTLHEQVALFYPVESASDNWLVMTELADSQGTWTMLSPTGEATAIAEGVPLKSKRTSPVLEAGLDGVEDEDFYELSALVTDVQGETGTLGLMLRDDPTTLESLSTGVRVGDFAFFSNMAAIGYLDEYDADAGTGRLVVYQTTLGVGSTVSENVVNFTELLWPWEGVLYTVKDGDEYSLWAARAK